MIRINLLAAERPAAKKRAAAAPGAVQAYLFLALFAGGAALLCAAAWWYKSSQIRSLDSQIQVAKQEQQKLQAIKVKVEALEQKRATAKKKVDLIEKLRAEQSGPVHMLDEISKALPDFVWLTAMDQTGPAVKFGGESNSLNSVAGFIEALEASGWFPDVNLRTSQEANNIVSFNLEAAFKNPAVTAQEKAAAAQGPIPGSTPAKR